MGPEQDCQPDYRDCAAEEDCAPAGIEAGKTAKKTGLPAVAGRVEGGWSCMAG